MSKKNIVAEIVEKKRADLLKEGYTFGIDIPKVRSRPINPFMAEKGIILEIKRASPSKGDIAPSLDAVQTARKYEEKGAAAISCLTERNYFKGSLKDLIDICQAVPNTAVLRKDFLIDEEEIEIAYLCGADAVLLICGILSLEKMLSMTKKCKDLGIKAFVEVRSDEDVEKVCQVKKYYADTIVCGVNSRNLKDFSIDLLIPAIYKDKLGGRVIFESGITSAQAARAVASMGFHGILLGESAARNPEMAGAFVKAFKASNENLSGKKLLELAKKLEEIKGQRPLVKLCGITRKEDLLLADKEGADFLGFIFAKKYGRNVYKERFDLLQPFLKEVKAFKVGVITDLTSEESLFAINLVKEGALDFIQFHGIDYASVSEELLQLPHFFAISNQKQIEAEKSAELLSFGEARFIQDCKAQNYLPAKGGWLAGGLTLENVEKIIAAYHPELIDISSGLEDEICGVKNAGKIKKLFESIRKIKNYQEI